MGGVENLPYLKAVDIPGFLRQRNPSLKVSIMNDGTAAALGEYWLGSGRGSRVLLCITLGTGCLLYTSAPSKPNNVTSDYE